MNDYLSNLKGDLLTIIEEFINKGIVASSFNTNNLSIDFLSIILILTYYTIISNSI